ncbi:protein canopy homolog 2-like [Amphiura filiformis]|uniref:protein canopy homolog 2-like n=1 Tax=Amphiura filiformis TaxID=82378 RepID=UPI003B2202B6
MVKMSVNKVFLQLLFCVICQLVLLVSAKRNQVLYCGACQALVDEVQYAIDSEDPTKMIDFGFRIDPKGGAKRKNVKYAGSETHMMELLDEVCDNMNDYAENMSQESNARRYVRYKDRMMEYLDIKNLNLDKGVQKSLELACANIIEEHEEEILRLYREKEENIADQLCREVGEYCTTKIKNDEL